MAIPARGLTVLRGSFGGTAAHIHVYLNLPTIAGGSRDYRVLTLPTSVLEEDRRGFTQRLLTGNSTCLGDRVSRMSSSLSLGDRVVRTSLHNNEESPSNHATPSSPSLPPELHHVTDFCIDEALQSPVSSLTRNLIIIILNQELPVFTPALWKQGQLHICADGGANRLYDELPYFFPLEDADTVRKRYIPDAIKGDFDSIRPEVKDYYAKLGTKIIDVSYDQDTTDLHKCICFVVEATPMVEQTKLVVLGALGGRLDHELASFHLLHEFTNLRIILLNDENLALLLPGGVRNVIKPNTAWQGPHCGLIPIGFPSTRTITTGLQWNLDGSGMAFGKLVSSSNRLNSNVITVVSDTPLLWTTEIRIPQREEHHCLLLLSRRAGKSVQNGRVHSL